jgi:hypothetical protein
VIVVDDHTLLAVLIGRASATQAPLRDDEVYTTGSWWYRLARAVQDPQFTGALSSKLATLQPDIRHVVVNRSRSYPRRSECSHPASSSRSWPPSAAWAGSTISTPTRWPQRSSYLQPCE